MIYLLKGRRWPWKRSKFSIRRLHARKDRLRAKYPERKIYYLSNYAVSKNGHWLTISLRDTNKYEQ
ncbi:hypothetical protein [Synechococcus phage BUCT-ZZ01]|nr:hypothetical protein [Synechococcus phage BUCT-ZZ01]